MASIIKAVVPACLSATRLMTPMAGIRTFALRKTVIPPVSEFSHADNAHRSDAEWRIAQVPVIEVDKPVVMCDGGIYLVLPIPVGTLATSAGVLGHPIEYLRVNGPGNKPVTCPYCGLRYKMKEHSH